MKQYQKVLMAIAKGDPQWSSALMAQAAAAKELNESTTMLDLYVPRSAPRLSGSDGPLGIRTFVIDGSGEHVGEILVWIAGGYVTCLEQAWYVGDAPRSWPEVEQLVAT